MKITESHPIQVPKTQTIIPLRPLQNSSSSIASVGEQTKETWVSKIFTTLGKIYNWIKSFFCRVQSGPEESPHTAPEEPPSPPSNIPPTPPPIEGTKPFEGGGGHSSSITDSSPPPPIAPPETSTSSSPASKVPPLPAPIIPGSPPKPVFSKEYTDNLTTQQIEDIGYTMDKLYNSSLLDLWNHETELKTRGERLKTLHPLRFLEHILRNHKKELASLPSILSPRWSYFHNELGNNIKTWNSLTFPAELQNFAIKFNLDFNHIHGLIYKEKFDKLLIYLINKK